MKKKVAISVVTILIVALSFSLVGCSLSPNKKIESITVGDGTNIKMGVYSDIQLNKSDTYNSKYASHLRATLELFKAQNVDLVLFAGDLVDLVSDEAYKAHNRIWDEVFGDNSPEKLYIMGNHDYWKEHNYNSTGDKQKKFKKYIGQSPWEHKIINGFHFIACSPSRGSGYDKRELKWLDEQLKYATEQGGKEKPIFVLTHHNVPDTVYGSRDWGSKELNGVFDNYSNVVSLSGHSHNAMLDERSIYQGKFTAIQTQSVAYIEQGDDVDKYNPDEDAITTIPAKADTAPMCYIVDVNQQNTTFQRWNVLKQVEEKAESRWVLDYPLKPTNFKYLRGLVEPNRTAPKFEEDAKVRTENVITKATNNTGLVFAPATHNDCVYSYLVKLTNTASGDVYTVRYFSEYYLGASAGQGDVRLGLPSYIESGTYTAEIWAQESFGKYSETSIKSDPFNYVKKAPTN